MFGRRSRIDLYDEVKVLLREYRDAEDRRQQAWDMLEKGADSSRGACAHELKSFHLASKARDRAARRLMTALKQWYKTVRDWL